MAQRIGSVALVVRDYDEAISYFVKKLNFTLVEDIDQGSKRWVLIAPPGSSGTSLLLARADGLTQEVAIGRQTGGRVFLFLHTDDFWGDYQSMVSKGVEFLEKPRDEPYGTVVVFQDLYGNKWDLLQLKDDE
jgi:catechol 2,3-dioxygenase-like lactoylglutathione lyase family enzyme